MSSAIGGTSGVTSISTLNATGGPLTGGVTFQGGTGVTLSVSSNVITINGSSGVVGPAPTSAPTLTATPGNAQVSLSWTTVSGATSYVLYNGSTLIFSGAGTSYTDTGLTNGTLYHYTVNAVFNNAAGPGGTASATPVAPVISGSASSSGTTGSAVVALPTNASGDLLQMFLWNDSNNSWNGNRPAGWSNVKNQATGTGNTTGDVFEIVSPGGLTSVTIVSIGQSHWRSIVANYGTKTIETATSVAGGSSTTAIVCPSITPTAGAHGMSSYYFGDSSATATASVQAGQASVVNGGIAVGTETVTGTAATGTRTGSTTIAAFNGGITTLCH